MSKTVVLFLERAGERRKLEFKLSPLGAAKVAGEIRRCMREGWKLVDATGDARVTAFVRKQVESYKEAPKKYKVPLKETVKLGTSIIKPKGKVKMKLREKVKLFRRKKDD